jgi:hypothetical protein
MTDPTLTLNRGQAARAAMLFGNAQVLLQAGHAFGQNIVTGFGEVPTRDLDPIYIRMAGIEAAFLRDGASYAWDSNGLVVSADLSLSGVTGYTGASAPSSSWVRLPVASTGLNPTPVPDTDVTVKANSIAIPAGFNPRDPASVAAALAALPTNGSDRYAVSQPDDLLLIIPVLESESAEVMTGGFISAIEYEYVLTLPAETFSLATGGVVEEFSNSIAEGTVAPQLGANSATSSTGWTLIQDGSVDDGSVQTGNFGFTFTLAGTGYTSCYVGSNGYITFGGGSDEYSGLDAINPNQPKILFAPGDRSFQRVYTQTGTLGSLQYASVRYEGTNSTSGSVGSSNIIAEITFFSPIESQQWVEIRFGTNAGTVSNFMIASSSTAYATATSTANSSWVLVGNSSGTSWTMTPDRYVAWSAN